MRRALVAARDHVDLDACPASKAVDADAGARGQPSLREITRVDGVHLRVVVVEVPQIHADGDDIVEREMAAFEHGDEVLHHLMRLLVDGVRIRGIVGGSRKRHLTGDEDPSIGFDRVTEWRDRIRRAADHVEEKRGHASTFRRWSAFGSRPAKMCDKFPARSRNAADMPALVSAAGAFWTTYRRFAPSWLKAHARSLSRSCKDARRTRNRMYPVCRTSGLSWPRATGDRFLTRRR